MLSLNIMQIHENVFIYGQLMPATAKTISKFSQLQDIVAIIARYAVMENLYQGSRLSLKPEYRPVLLSLCSSILECFAASSTFARSLMEQEKMPEEKNLQVENCDQLMEPIKEEDKACQSFRSVVKAKDESAMKSRRRSRM
jgi:hypothetical protein